MGSTFDPMSLLDQRARGSALIQVKIQVESQRQAEVTAGGNSGKSFSES